MFIPTTAKDKIQVVCFLLKGKTLGVDTKRPGSSYKEHEEPTEATGCLVLRGMSIFYHLLMFYLDFRNNGTNGTFPDVTSLLELTSTLPPAHNQCAQFAFLCHVSKTTKKEKFHQFANLATRETLSRTFGNALESPRPLIPLRFGRNEFF